MSEEKLSIVNEGTTRMRKFLSLLTDEQRAMLRNECSGDGLGLLGGFFNTSEAADYSFGALSEKHKGRFDDMLESLRSFLSTIEGHDFAKGALFLGALQNGNEKELKPHEVAREAVDDLVGGVVISVDADTSSRANTIQSTRSPILMEEPSSLDKLCSGYSDEEWGILKRCILDEEVGLTFSPIAVGFIKAVGDCNIIDVREALKKRLPERFRPTVIVKDPRRQKTILSAKQKEVPSTPQKGILAGFARFFGIKR